MLKYKYTNTSLSRSETQLNTKTSHAEIQVHNNRLIKCKYSNPYHTLLKLVGIKQNLSESKSEPDYGGNFKVARMQLNSIEPTSNDSCIFQCISSRVQLEYCWNTVGILRILSECSWTI